MLGGGFDKAMNRMYMMDGRDGHMVSSRAGKHFNTVQYLRPQRTQQHHIRRVEPVNYNRHVWADGCLWGVDPIL